MQEQIPVKQQEKVIKLRTKRDFTRFHDHRARERRSETGNGKYTPKA